MNKKNNRRDALRKLAMAPALFSAPVLMGAITSGTAQTSAHRVQYSVNAYSFNDELRNGLL